MGHRVVRCRDPEDIGRSAATYIHRVYLKSLEEKDSFSLVLSGGKTPEVLYRTLAALPFRDLFQWHRVHLFWGDERFVPKSNPESNFTMAQRSLISSIQIPDENLFPIPTDLRYPTEGAKAYEKILRNYFLHIGTTTGSPPMPLFDLILLGLGEDGHTASLFPGNQIDQYTATWVESVEAPPSYPTRERITLTLPVLNAAANVAFLVSGGTKKETLERVLRGKESGKKTLPAQLVAPRSDIHWFTDIVVKGF
jgi:6-phosphogluconolactonase